MSGETELASVQSLTDTVTERIKATFVSLIPEDEWKGMVSAELSKLMTPKDSYHRNSSPLQDMIKAAIQERFRQVIAEELGKPDWQGEWDGRAYKPSELVAKLVQDAGPALFKTALAEFVNSAIEGFKLHLENRPQREW